ncbi:uncharacterized protein LOC132936517 [Metopolophium dirhodum]|uniref:uncharacterized protein LOC132936517 n=1 Tax=Metopolophium dirhodum TaxID=44670 RepID=UPI00298FFBED|nr:uncharacterized protein LOC132936517 [Metopolophium dirhodum]
MKDVCIVLCSCCGEIMFKGCVHDVDVRASMIFSCTTLLQLVMANNVDEVHVDATFKVVPSNTGSQFLIIHCMIENYSIPIVYCLMECKTRNTYNCVFNFLKTHHLANLNPSIVITDYETVLRDTLKFIFPAARITGVGFATTNYWLRQVGLNIISINGLPRQNNNSLESFHNTLRNIFNVAHPNLWIFLGNHIYLIFNLFT